MGQAPSHPEAPSPSLAEIVARQRAEAAAEQARQDAEAARAEIVRLVQEHQESQQKVMEAHMSAMQAAAVAQAQAYAEMMAVVQAERAANEARMKAEEAARTATDEAKQSAAQAEEERKRAVAMREQAIKDAQATAEMAKKLEDVANEEKRKATALQEAANSAKKAAEEEVAKANAALGEAKRQLKEGIQPVVMPSPEEVRIAKRKVQYQEDLFHFAVAGTSGGGKSSLINAFRGLRNKDYGAAATGVAETTRFIARYSDSNVEAPYAWYDIPGAGTLKIPDWQYFNAQGLYVFDCIIILFDSRFTMTDIAILTNCRRFNIPTYIVRSKADQHILNIIQDMPDEDDEDDDDETRNKRLYPIARRHFIELTRQTVKDNLESANLPDQRVYIVSKDTMTAVVRDKRPKQVIDEIQLLNDLIGEAQIRRSRRDGGAASTRDV